mgnify:CR=1 FL=1
MKIKILAAVLAIAVHAAFFLAMAATLNWKTGPACVEYQDSTIQCVIAEIK